MAKDYYKILGVDKNATQEEIKKNFRKLSKEFHPDRCHDESKKGEYEEKFKEIAEAYSVLSDEEKRKQYDDPMSGGANFNFEGFGGTSFEDLFNSFGFGHFNPFGGFGMRGNKQQIVKGQSIRVTINVTLEEVLSGVKKTIKYNRYDKCPKCNGTGKVAETQEVTCPHCGGTGTEFRQNGAWQQISTCTHCGGKGHTLKNPCSDCGGEGLVVTKKEVEIEIPKGAANGTQIAYNGLGNAPKGEGQYGDLLVVVNELEHEKFVREDNNLYFEIELNVVDAILGCNKEITTLDGKKLISKINPYSDNGTKYRFMGEGLPDLYNPSKRGNMYGVVNIKMPKNITDEERRLLEELRTKPNFR